MRRGKWTLRLLACLAAACLALPGCRPGEAGESAAGEEASSAPQETEGSEMTTDAPETTGTVPGPSSGEPSSQTPPPTGEAFSYAPLSQAYAPVTGGNPLKGFIPYKGVYDTIPYTMEWWYIPLSALMSGPDAYTFETGLDPVLDEIASRGNQAVFRIYLDYPDKEKDASAVPQFIWDMGVRQIPYTNMGRGIMPDYTDQRLIDVLVKFVREMGRRYDGDPRIGFITCGLVGHWGEWHNYPDGNMPSNAQQNQIFLAYEEAFPTTKIQARYPDSAGVSSLQIGFHDDSFTESTIGTESWYFLPRMKKMVALDKWKTEAIGGEFRPEGQKPFLNGTKPQGYQDYVQCVEETHCTWLMMHAAFSGSLTAEQKRRAAEGSDRLGYELYAASSSVAGGAAAAVSVKLENRGVAPFYYNWKVRLGVVQNGKLAASFDTDWALTDCLPGTPVEYRTSVSPDRLPKGTSTLVLMVENPLKNGKRFRFANASQDKDLKGWVTLGTVTRL